MSWGIELGRRSPNVVRNSLAHEPRVQDLRVRSWLNPPGSLTSTFQLYNSVSQHSWEMPAACTGNEPSGSCGRFITTRGAAGQAKVGHAEKDSDGDGRSAGCVRRSSDGPYSRWGRRRRYVW